MKKKPLFKRILAGSLAAALIVNSLSFSAFAEDSGAIRLVQVSNDRVSAPLPSENVIGSNNDVAPYLLSEIVRVSIVLKDKSTVERMSEMRENIEDIAQNPAAVSYREELEDYQEGVISKIEGVIGETLDVVWNLTLAANIISANVEYQQIKEIEKLEEVDEVLIETQYSVPVVEEDSAVDSRMASSSLLQTYASTAWQAGYTGAGSRIAIIDSGINYNHQSFDNGSYLYSLGRLAEVNGCITDDEINSYIQDLGLLTAERYSDDIVEQLNAGKHHNGEFDSNKLYFNEKIPFVYDYADGDSDVMHDKFDGSEHGSHVAGIAAANRYIKTGESYADALDTVLTQGVAPDAQILAMKVGDSVGIIYDSDYMVAIEDAIILGADAINLSLGSPNPGASRSSVKKYQEILDNLTKNGAVVTMSAGNEGYWAQNAANVPEDLGLLYSDDVSMDTVGVPASYTNSLAVASVDNNGFTDNVIEIQHPFSTNSIIIRYKENDNDIIGGKVSSFSTLEGSLNYADCGDGDDFTSVSGKVVLFQHNSEDSFADKAKNAYDAGAVAIIMYDNNCTTLNEIEFSNTDSHEWNIPYAFISPSDADKMKTYCDSGTMRVFTGAFTYTSDNMFMSPFSGWGVPGSLELKPEITAPGGGIYSVDGNDDTSYKNMSGTSMATPQVAGLTALMAQHIRKDDNIKSVLEGENPPTKRALIQSLLMSTAVPVWGKDYNGNDFIYPVLQQGAGLANAVYAIAAESYIMMNEDATDSYADGKIKAELGDDPERTGEYSFSYTIHNFSDITQYYRFDTDLFIQDVFSDVNENYLSPYTIGLGPSSDYNVVYKCGSDNVDVLDIGPGKSKTIQVEITLDDSIKEYLNFYYDNGTYIEGYTCAYYYKDNNPTSNPIMHSIPILGFYGNWTDPSMFDVGTLYERLSGEEVRAPYCTTDEDTNYFVAENPRYPGNPYYLGINPVTLEYKEEYASINSGDAVSYVKFSPIRNAAGSRFSVINEKDSSIPYSSEYGAVPSAFYLFDDGWQNNYCCFDVNFVPEDWDLKNGDKIKVRFTLAPEYYENPDGSIAWEKLGEGAYFELPLTIDDEAPKINLDSVKIENNTLKFEATDNLQIAAVCLINAAGDDIIASDYPENDNDNEFAVSLDKLSNSTPFLIQIIDYANNAVTYAYEPDMSGISYDFNGDGKTNKDDVKTLLDYRVGNNTAISNITKVDVDGNGNFDTHDAHELLSEILPLSGGNKTEKITLVPDNAVMAPDNTCQLNVSIEPSTVPVTAITWLSSDTEVATVDENGLVTAHKAGDCVITAQSDFDESKKATCNITVENIDINITGILQKSNSHTIYQYECKDGQNNYKAKRKIENLASVYAAAADASGNFYVYDAGIIQKLDPNTLNVTDSEKLGGIEIADMAHSVYKYPGDSSLFAMLVDDTSVMLWKDLMNFTADNSLDFSDLLSRVGADRFIALTSCGTATDNDGNIFEYYMMMDNKGNLWQLTTDPTSKRYEPTLIEYPSVMPDNFLSGNPKGYNCSMVTGTDGNLYLSVYNGRNSTDFYRIKPMIDENGNLKFMASHFGKEQGYSAMFTAVAEQSQSYSTAAYIADSSLTNETLISGELSDIPNEILSKKLMTVPTAEEMFNMPLKAPKAPVSYLADSIAAAAEAENKSSVEISGDKTAATLKLVNDTAVPIENGLYVIKYDPTVFEFKESVSHENYIYTYKNDQTNGVIIAAYVSNSPISSGEPLQSFIFTVKDAEKANEGFGLATLETNRVNKLAKLTDDSGNYVKSLDTTEIIKQINSLGITTDRLALSEVSGGDDDGNEGGGSEPNVPNVPNVPNAPNTPSVPDVSVGTTEPSQTSAPSQTEEINTLSPDVAVNANPTDTVTVTSDSVSADTSAADDGSADENGAKKDKNIGTGVILIAAPAAVSALAVLVSKKRRK